MMDGSSFTLDRDAQADETRGFEAALLGALLADSRAFEEVASLITADDFLSPAHAAVYRKIEAVASNGGRPTAITLAPYLRDDPVLRTFTGGAQQFLAGLTAQGFGLPLAPVQYARAVREASQTRGYADALERALADLRTPDPERSAAQKIEALFAGLEARDRGLDDEIQAITIGDAAEQALADAEEARRTGRHISGLATGYTALDEMIGGLGAGELVILAGRPGMGKTALAEGIARRVAAAGTGVVFFSQEMGARQVGRRSLAGESGIGLTAIKRGRYGADSVDGLVRGVGRLKRLPLHLIDRPNLSPGQTLLETRRLRRRTGNIGLVIVDHMQIMSGGDRQYSNRTAELTAISKGLKAAAKRLELPVIALSQLSRAVEMREDKRPVLSDLRESGSIEQDADVVLCLYRHHYYLAQERPVKGKESPEAYSARLEEWTRAVEACEGVGEALGRKLRDGEIGRVLLGWDGAKTMFSDLDMHHEPEGMF